MKHSIRPQALVTDKQLREAEEGLRRLLHAKRFPRQWVEEYSPELMSQARTEFAARLAIEPIDNSVGLLVVIAYRRALNLVRAERSRPRISSIETAFHLADEDTPTPEEEALDHDRQLRLVEAMSHLPERERKLLALVYFEEMPLGEAGRKLGWAKASATRHHQAALDRLRVLVGDRSLLSPEIAVPAYVAARHDSAPRAILTWLGGATESLRETVMLGGGRVGPLAETGNAAALSGAGRTAAGVCAVAATCVVAATAVVGPGVAALGGSGDGHRTPRVRHLTQAANSAEAGRRSYQTVPTPASSSVPPHSRQASRAERSGVKRGEQGSQPESEPRPAPSGNARDTAPNPKESVNEFGVEKGEAEIAPEPRAEPESTSSPPSARPAAPISSGSQTKSTDSPSGSSSRSSRADSEARSEVGF